MIRITLDIHDEDDFDQIMEILDKIRVNGKQLSITGDFNNASA